jgi:hypothetical protein
MLCTDIPPNLEAQMATGLHTATKQICMSPCPARLWLVLQHRHVKQYPFLFLFLLVYTATPPLLLFPTCSLVEPRTLITWVSCMQVRASCHTAVCRKQGSTVHDLRHAHKVQSIPCKAVPSVSPDKKTKQCLAYNMPPSGLSGGDSLCHSQPFVSSV